MQLQASGSLGVTGPDTRPSRRSLLKLDICVSPYAPSQPIPGWSVCSTSTGQLCGWPRVRAGARLFHREQRMQPQARRTCDGLLVCFGGSG